MRFAADGNCRQTLGGGEAQDFGNFGPRLRQHGSKRSATVNLVSNERGGISQDAAGANEVSQAGRQ
jgi:hypothetical protein